MDNGELPPTEGEDVLDLTTDQEIETGDEGEEEALIGFADEEGAEEEETPVIKRLREQNRELAKKLRQRNVPQNDTVDPEPVVPNEPDVEDFDYDVDRFAAANRAYIKALKDHAEWERREDQRKASQGQQQEERARKIEKQKSALGVRDFDERASEVKDRLSDAQLAILIEGADDPARLIYALGRSATRLEMLAGEENMAKFAVMIGRLEKDIKVSKKSPPPPESGRVRGATASLSLGDKELDRLEKEAEKTGDRSKIIAYNRAKRQAA